MMAATPKAVINGMAIWDVRHVDRNSGWYVTCANDDHMETFAYSYRLSDAKLDAATMVCAECANPQEPTVRTNVTRTGNTTVIRIGRA
jgi:hypothetical protein